MRGRACALMMTLVLLLSACGGKGGDQADELVQDVRSAYLAMETCTAHMELTADYGQRVFTYGMELSWQRDGETVLTLTSPENVAGTSAVIAAGETALEYEGVMVETGPLDGAGLSPIDAVPALLAYAREGFIAESALEERETGQWFHITCRDPENEPGAGLEGDLWFDPESYALLRGEISNGGFTVIQCDFTNFAMTKGAEE